MKSRRLKAILLIILFPLLFSMNMGCEMADDDEIYKLVIYSLGGGFSGIYMLDNELTSFSCTTSDSNGVYTYEKKLGSFTSIDVDAYGLTSSTSYIKAILYKDDDKLSSDSDSYDSDDGNATISLSYTTDDSDDDDD
jgi:hypothetical protein